MAGQADIKKKTLLIKDYLLKYSDEENPVSTNELIEMLKNNGIECERKSIYNDISILGDCGLDIIKTRKNGGGYFIGSRDFELVEVRLLIDAVQSAGFITAQKSKKLIKKIGSLCSEAQMKKLTQQVYIDNRVKNKNESIYYYIDILSDAIASGKMISCKYLKCRDAVNVAKVKMPEKDLTLSPYALIWSADHYYLVANNSKYDNLMHLRIDRMKNVKLIEGSTARPFEEVCEYRNYFDVADYSKRVFNMFSGAIEDIELWCHIDVLEQILDRFGEDVSIRQDFDNEDHFFVRAKAAVSPGLVSWLMQFENNIKVLSPQSLIDGIMEKIIKISAQYKSDD